MLVSKKGPYLETEDPTDGKVEDVQFSLDEADEDDLEAMERAEAADHRQEE